MSQPRLTRDEGDELPLGQAQPVPCCVGDSFERFPQVGRQWCWAACGQMTAHYLGLGAGDQCAIAVWVLRQLFTVRLRRACDAALQALPKHAGRTLTRPQVTRLQQHVLGQLIPQRGAGREVDPLIAEAICVQHRPVLILLGSEEPGGGVSGHLVLLICATMKGDALETVWLADPDTTVGGVYPVKAAGLRSGGATIHGPWINTWVL